MVDRGLESNWFTLEAHVSRKEYAACCSYSVWIVSKKEKKHLDKTRYGASIYLFVCLVSDPSSSPVRTQLHHQTWLYHTPPSTANGVTRRNQRKRLLLHYCIEAADQVALQQIPDPVPKDCQFSILELPKTPLAKTSPFGTAQLDISRLVRRTAQTRSICPSTSQILQRLSVIMGCDRAAILWLLYL